MYHNPIYNAQEPKTWPKRVTGACLIVCCILIASALYTYNINEMGWSLLNPKGAETAAKVPCTNALGLIGLYLAGILYAFLGAAAVYLLMLLPIMGIAMIMYPHQSRTKQWIALCVMVLSACAVLAIQPWILTEWAANLALSSPGGKLGYLDGTCVVEELAGKYYGITLLLLIHALAIIYFARLTPQDVCTATKKDLGNIYAAWREKRRLRNQALEEADREWQLKGQEIERLEPIEGATKPRKQRDFSLDLEEEPIRQPLPAARRRPLPEHPIEQQQPLPQYKAPAKQSSTPAPLPLEDEHELPRPFAEQIEQALQSERHRVSTQPPPTARKRNTPTISATRDNLLDLMRPIEDAIETNTRVHVEGPSKGQMPHNERLLQEIERHTRPTNTPIPESTPKQLPPRREQLANPPAPKQEEAKPRKTAPPAPLLEDKREQYDDYPLPPYDLLAYHPEPPEVGIAAREEMYDMQQRIVETLENFKITVEPGDITRGPSITRYEFYPPRGLRVNRISNLSSDLMLATESKSVNILAPIPGKNTVGIELENATKSPVYLRELLQSDAFHNPKLRIPVALGKDVYGNAVIGDLAAMPHTLVAGTTGSGKSVCINSMILSMLYKFRPDELRLILVDPKVVEMQPYKKLPHLACPVVTNPARVIGALRWAVNEMEHRYKLFSKIGVRNFEDFNNRPLDFVPEPEEDEVYEDDDQPIDYAAIEAMASEIERQAEDEIPLGEEEQDEFDFEEEERIPSKLPYIVIFIDELADLMMVVKEDLENYIARLTQKARAAGIHLVVATQTPRANVVTGMIKANIPSRIALKVSSPLDSRIILDMTGAENLLGKGDFLFLPPAGITKLTRAQGAFVSDAEIASIIKFCASHAKQNFEQGVTAEMNNSDNVSAGGGGDNGGRLGGKGLSDEDAELYTRCVNLVVTERKASTSLLQRRFSIGYGRAAKIMDMMEERGVISPPQGATRAREVLIDAP